MNDDHDRRGLPWMPPALLGLLCALQAAALLVAGPRPAVVAPAERPPLEAQAPPLPEALREDPGFTSRMTPDDVARGVQALAALPAGAPERLSPEQRAALAPLAAQGAALRQRLGELRMRRRAEELDWTRRSAEAASALTAEQRRALAPAIPQIPHLEPANMQPPERR
ncbi:MAG: hypothetical protein H6740_21535 [Alphaproteobacteria bacterium]|nr:hypothetical protein [Alphaproteobacteria bacterium]